MKSSTHPNSVGNRDCVVPTCDDTASNGWSLVSEMGVVPSNHPATGIQFACPGFATKAADGSCWIVDELGKEKIVPFRFESRSVRVNERGDVTFNTMDLGIDDGFACPIDDGQQVVLFRCKWELVILSRQGTVTRRIPLSRMSKRMPRYVTWTDQNTFLVVFCNRGGEVDIIEVDRDGRLLWFLPPDVDLGIAGSVQRLPQETLLIADPFRHVVLEIDRRGKTVWKYGMAGQPSQAEGHLSRPNSARELPDGRRLIADMGNHRVLFVSPDGVATPLDLEHGRFCAPMFAEPLPNGHYLVCDTGNLRVVEIDEAGAVIQQWGSPASQERLLSYPRSVEVFDGGKYLVADTAHDRILEFSDGRVRERPVNTERPIFWPRCVRPLPSGGMLIADGRNGRIVEVDAAGDSVRNLETIDLATSEALQDPHDVRQLSGDRLLIVDSSRDLVVEADWTGRVYQAFGNDDHLKLKDPHSGQKLADGRIVIADTGHHRVLIVGPDGKCITKLEAVHSADACYRLNSPRYAEIDDNGTMVIADTGNNRILGCTAAGEFLWECSHVPGGSSSRLSQPRWVQLINQNEVVVCDHFHHRIVHVKKDR